MSHLPITIFFSIYNDEVMTPFTVKWYRDRFPAARMIAVDNYSTDRCVELARGLGCEVIYFKSGETLPIDIGIWFKDNIWKVAGTDWILIVDCDEFLDLSETDLMEENRQGVSVIRSLGYDAVNLKEDYDIEGMVHGVLNPYYDKLVCWNKAKIKEINYGKGCHEANPEGEVKLSVKAYNLLHKPYVNTQYLLKKYERNGARMSPEHRAKGYGEHYFASKFEIIKEIDLLRKKAVLIKKPL
jgi:hypothetical protein